MTERITANVLLVFVARLINGVRSAKIDLIRWCAENVGELID